MTSSNVSKFRIAVVDDEPDILQNLKDLLESEGCYEVECFVDSEEAYHKLCESPPDLLLTDILMPRMDGLELLMGLRILIPDFPAIILSGFVDMRNTLRALRLGATDLLQKPYDDETLLESVALAVGVGQARKRIIHILRETDSDGTREILGELDRAQKLLMARVLEHK